MYETETITYDDGHTFETWTHDAAAMLSRIYGAESYPSPAHMLLIGYAPFMTGARGTRTEYVRAAQVQARRAGWPM